jgi:hypothetical protein
MLIYSFVFSCRSPAALRGRKLRDVKKEELQSPIETSILYYLKQALDWLTQDQPLFYFGLGALAACVLMLALRCCYVSFNLHSLNLAKLFSAAYAAVSDAPTAKL